MSEVEYRSGALDTTFKSRGYVQELKEATLQEVKGNLIATNSGNYDLSWYLCWVSLTLSMRLNMFIGSSDTLQLPVRLGRTSPMLFSFLGK